MGSGSERLGCRGQVLQGECSPLLPRGVASERSLALPRLTHLSNGEAIITLIHQVITRAQEEGVSKT